MNHPMDYVLAIAYPASALSAPGKNLDLGVRNVSREEGRLIAARWRSRPSDYLRSDGRLEPVQPLDRC